MMNHNFRRFLISAVIMITILTGTAAAFANCVCLDQNGNQYPDGTASSAVCYVCDANGCTPNGTYGQQCSAKESGLSDPVPQTQEQPVVVQQPVVQQPVTGSTGTVTGGNDASVQNGQNNTGAADTGTTGTDTNTNTDTNTDAAGDADK